MRKLLHGVVCPALFSLLTLSSTLLFPKDAIAQEPSCVVAGDVYQEESLGLAEVNLGAVRFVQAESPTQGFVPLNVRDCSGDQSLDVEIPWSEGSAIIPAKIEISPNLCGGNAPEVVEVVLRHGNHCILHGLNEAGAEVATATAASHPAPQALLLGSPGGIRTIEVEGSEICVLRVCWYCECMPVDDCVEAGDVFEFPATSLPEVNLGWVTFTQARGATGGPIPLNVLDCSQDGRLDVNIPWSEASAAEKAALVLSPVVCCGNAPQVVEVILQHGNHCILRGLNDAGAPVAMAVAAPHPAPQSLLLAHPSGIRTILVEGSEICVLRVCWRCVCEPLPDCVEAGDVFAFPVSGLLEVNLGWVTFTEALMTGGVPVPLDVLDCAGDGQLDVSIPWSEAAAEELARIAFSPYVCCGTAPKKVEITLQHGKDCALFAYDDLGNLVDEAIAEQGPPPKLIVLSSPAGIRTIRVQGSEICVLRVCWSCEAQPILYPDPIWVDVNSEARFEDGSERYPFRTIAGALAVAVTHTIQVRPGVYFESVELPDGVKLIGSGADATILSPMPGGILKGPGGVGAGITCIGVGPGTLVAGFTITGASVGIYCVSSSPMLRENLITDIAPGDLGGDGIRLDNSSPHIQNNVICHVGGMGIRAQGDSEPQIVNNTIYDYGYYAGISFAALDIGDVTPVIKNNIVVRGNEEPVGGILWRQPASPLLSYNDVFDPADVTGGGSYYAEHDGVAWNETPGGPGAISEDPMFVDEAHCYLYLEPTSPCIDAGDPDSAYNDVDGSRNDMGAFGGSLLDPGSGGHAGSGFILTSIGKIPVTEIDRNPLSLSYGLAVVSPTAAADFHIPQYTDSPFGGYLYVRGVFGATDPVDYYQIYATPEGATVPVALDDPLSKVRFTIEPDGTVTTTTVPMGPQTIGGVPNLYLLNREGYWSHEDLRMIWNTTGLNGRYLLTYQAYQLSGTATVAPVVLPPNELDHLTVYLDNSPLTVSINDVMYADHTPIEECEDIIFPHNASSELIFNITAYQAGGFLNHYVLDCAWGHNHYGGRFTYDQYVGSHDSPPPHWNGVMDLELPALLPRDGAGNPVPWEDCAYGFNLYALSRTTNGYWYLQDGYFTMLHSVESLPKSQALASAACADCPAPQPEPSDTVTIAQPLPPIPPGKIPSALPPAPTKGIPGDTIWVDDDNLGSEDGSEANPYNTINEGIGAAFAGDTVRVLPGQYFEKVDLVDGVNVIGSGAESTIIDASGAMWAVECIGIGPTTLFAGFGVTNARVGVYCHTSNLSLRELIITDISPGTPADGIRLDDSSPLIRNNVIYHVEGMGIRSQGNSAPDIVNNTIYDYEYYAGISFAALNIGPGSPVVKNNIVIRGNEQPVAGILWNATVTPVLSYNDVFDPANTTGGGSFYAVHDGVSWMEVPGGVGAISADAQFIDPVHGYFQLEPASPCVDAGDPNPAYNDNDGSRNDMGAYGGERLELGAPSHGGSGLIFTTIGNVPTTELVRDATDLSHALLRVSDEAAAAFHIPKYTDSPLGGYLWLHGLFGVSDDVDYYQIVAAPYGTAATETLTDPLVKHQFTINPDGSVTTTRVSMGPQTVGGVPNVYLLNRTGYWTFTDLRYIWNTTGLNGKYTVSYKAYRQLGDGSLVEVVLPRNELDQFTAYLNNTPVQMRIENIAYADHTPIAECEKIALPHNGDSSLIFTVTGWHPDGFLRYYLLNCYWGNNRYGGQFTYDQYVGSHDSAPPTWQGVFEYEFPPLLPRDSEGAVMDWHNCAYRFHLEGSSRITDGVSYLNWGSDDVYQSVVIAGATTTVTPTPVVTSTPTPTPTVVPPTPTPTATQGGGFLTDILPYFPLPEPFVILEPLINEDLSIHGIEVTQGIQCFNAGAGLAGCPDNSLPLVINKSTVARVYMDYSNIFPFITQRDDVQVRLYLRWNDDDFVSALASGRARATIDQSNAANSGNVYFYISSSANSGTLDLYAEVDPSDLVSESNESNNRFPSAGFVSIDFFKRDTLKIVGRRVRYHPAGYSGDQYAGGWAVNGGGATWLNQLLPIKNSGINYSNASGNLDWTSSLSGSTNQHTLISYLNTVWLLENIFSFFFTGSFTGADHVYGWTPDDGFSGGHADMPVYPHAGGLGVVAIGTDNPGTSTDNPGSGALIFGHELVHDYDVYHTNTGADDCGSDDSNSDFPYATSSIQEFGFNAATGMVYNPANTHDLMSYCPSGGSKLGWISPFTWNKMFNNLSAKKFAEKTLSPLEDPSPGVLYKTLAEQSLVLNVSIQNPDYNAGAIGGELGELYLIDAGATVVLPTGEYAIELRMDNVPLSRRDFVVSFKSEDEGDPDFPTMDASFAIPWEAGTDTVVLLHQDEVLDQREISPNKPTVTITSPSGAAAWVSGVTETLAWQGEDLDGDSMSYTVLFGRDGGSSWQLLVTGLTESSLNVEVDALAGTEDGRFQVVATDGVNIGMDETDGPISIPTKDPEAVIVDPQEGMRFSPGALVVLQGIGTDLEDGLLPDEALQWSSDLQGDLGVGPIVPINTLTSGEHLITLRVTDSDGQEGIGAVSIVINTPESFKVDLNLDGLINHEDILELLERVGESIEDGFPPTKADLDRNGRVDSDDLIEMSRFYQSAQ